MLRAALALCCALLLAAGAASAATPQPAAPTGPRLTESQAVGLVEREPKVADWLARYPRATRVEQGSFDGASGLWTVRVWSQGLEIVEGKVVDSSGAVSEAWTGPQVAWRMARGYDGAFGGKQLENPWLWYGFCALFLVGLADLRRPLSLRNLDLAMLLSFAVSLHFFNVGRIFTSVPLVYPGLVYLLARCVWIARRGRPPRASRPVWPVWLLAAVAVFVSGFRVGLDVTESNVIDVGYSGVIGADRIVRGESPYGHFPVQGTLKPCGPADASGVTRDRLQTNGRCESANDRGDTYGPWAYLAYVPGYALFGWSGKWDLAHGGSWPDLPAVHATTILFDVLALVGLALVGRRFGGGRLAATLAFAWATYPFTLWAAMSNTNDLIPPAFLVLGFWLATSPWARGALGAVAGWTKFAALVVAPLWATYPERRLRPTLRFCAAFAAATLASAAVLALEPDVLHAARVFWDRTIGWQVGRDSPFSLWDWGQYRAAGVPDLHLVQRVLEGLLVAGALAAAWWPRRKSPLQLAALTCALLVGFELVLTYWLYSYLPWFFPFAAFAVLAEPPARAPEAAPELDERDVRELAVAR